MSKDFIAGVTNLPDLIAASKISDFFNFDVADGEDADSVQIQIASDEINEIRHLISGKVLEILTIQQSFIANTYWKTCNTNRYTDY